MDLRRGLAEHQVLFRRPMADTPSDPIFARAFRAHVSAFVMAVGSGSPSAVGWPSSLAPASVLAGVLCSSISPFLIALDADALRLLPRSP